MLYNSCGVYLFKIYVAWLSVHSGNILRDINIVEKTF